MNRVRALADADAWTLKLARARHHVGDLRAAFANFLQAQQCRLDQVRLPEGGWGLVLRAPQPPPPEFALIVGDTLHNIRSALDTRFIDAVSHLLGDELTDDEARPLGLPTVATSAELDERMKRLSSRTPRGARIRDSARVLALSVQSFGPPSPYWNFGDPSMSGSEDASEAQHALGRVLGDLSAMSNQDKHRGLHYAWWTSNDIFAATDGRDVRWAAKPTPWSDGDTVVTLNPRTPDPAFLPTLQGTVTLALPGTSALRGFDLAGQLEGLLWWASTAIQILDLEIAHSGQADPTGQRP